MVKPLNCDLFLGLSNLTVLIPTIGRHSIHAAIKSISPECKIHIIRDKDNCESDFLEDLSSDRIKLFTSDESGAGPVKRYAIDTVKSKYFLILDDDDQLIPGFLELSILMMSSDPKLTWMSTHWKEGIDSLITPQCDIIDSFEQFEKYYFVWDEYHLRFNKFIYPNSSIIIKTEAFINYLESGGSHFASTVNDDIIPMTEFMMNYPGINHRGYGFIVGKTPNSVSRGRIEFTDAHKDLLYTIALHASNGKPIVTKIWRKVMNNLLNIWNQANKNN